MKTSFFTLVFCLTVILSANMTAVGQTNSTNKTLTELIKITNEIYDAGISGDANVIEKYYADSFLETDAAGILRDKSFNSQNFLPSSIKMTYKIESPQLRQYDNIAILYYTWLVHEEVKPSNETMKSREPPVDVRLQVTDTYIKTNSGWKIVCSSRIPLPIAARGTPNSDAEIV